MKLFTVLFASYAASAVAQSGCGSGIQSILAPLADYPPAASFCSAKYPRTVTVTGIVKRQATSAAAKAPSTTKTTSQKTTTTKKPPSTSKTTTKTTTKAASTTTTKATSTTVTTTKDTKAALYSSLVAQASSVVSTFCQCKFPPSTVTSKSSTTTTTTPSPTTTTTTTTTTTITTTTSSSCVTPTSDPRCERYSGLCCPGGAPGECTPCTNTGVVCVKVCDVDNDCVYGGLRDQYEVVVGYYNSNLCVGYNGCSGCPASKMFARDGISSNMGRRRVQIERDRDMIVRRLI